MQLKLLQQSKNLLQQHIVLLNSLTVNQDIIQVNNNTLVQKIKQHMVHDPLKCARCICQPKWHYLEFKSPISAAKCGLVAVLLRHWKLVVCIVEVNLAKNSCSIQSRSQLVNPRQRVGVKDSVCIQLPVINTHPELTSFLFGKQDGCSIW